MKQYSDAKAEKSVGFESLPVSGYVVTIKKAREEEYSWGAKLNIAFDIAEGDFKDYYQRNLDGQNSENKKWKGIYGIIVPDENNKFFESQKNQFNNLLYALEESNKGFAWNWNAAANQDYKFLAGKKLGIVFRNEEWEFDGKSGWAVRPFKPYTVEEIKSGSFKIPKDKALKNKTASEPVKFEVARDIPDDEDLPF